jgi:hypothetical protein
VVGELPPPSFGEELEKVLEPVTPVGDVCRGDVVAFFTSCCC